MKPEKPPPPTDANEEIATLIQTLHQTGQRLEELTAGEVDAVADREGRTFLLRHAQEQLRHSEAAKQAAILNALPAHIALLDTQGRIISVNAAWQGFANANGIQVPQYGIGLNYLAICDSARGEDASAAHRAAAGIRSVLDGAQKSFSLEYPCHSPTEQRWFLMTVTPLTDDHPSRVVVMHLNIIERKRAEDALRESEARFRILTAMSSDFYWESDAEHRLTARASANKKLTTVTAFRRGAQIGERRWEIPYLSPDEAGWQVHRAVLDAHLPFRDFELSRRAADGAASHISISGDPVFDASGAFQGYRGVGTDITERKRAEEEIQFKNTVLQTQQETSLDAILLVGANEEIISYNQQFIDLWRLPPQLVNALVDAPVLQAVVGQVENSEAFVARIQHLYAHRDEKSREEVQLKDGRIVDRYSAPATGADGKYYGRIWYFRDITERKRLEQEEEQYFKFFMLSTNPMCIADPYGCFKQVNPAFLQLTGYSESELVSKPFLDFVLPEDQQRTADEMKLQVQSRPSMQFENRYVRNDGTVIYLSWMGYFDRHDGVSYAVANDITERKEAERRIAYLNRVYAVLSGINTLIVRVRDRDELFREACRIAVEEGGFRMSLIAMVDRGTMKIVPVASAGKDEDLLTAIKDFLSLSEGAPTTMTALAVREKRAVVSNDSQSDPRVLFGTKYGEAGVRSLIVLPLMVSDEAVGVLSLYSSETEFFQDEEIKLLTDLAGDIAYAIDHIDKQARLDYLAYYDALTGLANRSLFLERVAQHMRSAASGGHKLAVALIDLERFKNINDSLGRPAGDALLRQVTEWLTRVTGDTSLLARVGADHFAGVLPKLKQDGDVVRLLEKTMAAFLDHPFRLNDAVFRVAAKVGVALFPDDGADADTLFRNAEAALKKAKASGERYLFYNQKMTEAVAGKLTLENQLRQALNNEEFVLHYQPKVSLASGKLTGAEALIRWNDPRTGLVPPSRFIPVLEETGLIYDVGRWALKKAIADYLRWRAAGLPAVRIAVNVSPLQLRHRDFIGEIGQAIGIDAQAAAGLELEITESLIMEDIKHNIASLQAIRDLGVSIAIDDFGTGFSSLSYLAKLPVDTLKIDRSFVIDMTASPEGLALVSTIVSLAHSLNLKVVAEGVETEEQSRLLRLLACDEMQGFLFSKPVPAEIFEIRFLAPPPAA